jgi:hypothetical protein
MFEVNPWPYVYAALGLSYAVIAGYAMLLNRRRVAAENAIRELGGGDA